MKSLLVLIAGPYRSGTRGEPEKIAHNLRLLESAAYSVYKLGHLPMIGEWLALPLAREAGSTSIGDTISEAFLYPVAERLLRRCDAVLRIDGMSKGADDDVTRARSLGIPVYRAVGDLPMDNH